MEAPYCQLVKLAIILIDLQCRTSLRYRHHQHPNDLELSFLLGRTLSREDSISRLYYSDLTSCDTVFWTIRRTRAGFNTLMLNDSIQHILSCTTTSNTTLFTDSSPPLAINQSNTHPMIVPSQQHGQHFSIDINSEHQR